MDNVQVVNRNCMDAFVQEWINYGERTQFMALLFGRYMRKEGENGVREIALVYALYKPKQRWENGKIVLEKDALMDCVNGVSASLNLRCVGMVMTSAPHEDPITSFDVDFIAPLQLMYKDRADYASKFVTVIVKRDAKKVIEPIACMLSDQCICMYRDGLLLPPKQADKCKSTTTGKNKELLSSVIRNDEKMGSQEVTEFEPLFFLVELTVTTAKAGSISPIFRQASFPCVNSAQETRDTLLSRRMNSLLGIEELITTLKEGRRDPNKMRMVLSDFYLLIELASVIGVESVVDMCQDILNERPISAKSMVGVWARTYL